MNTRTKLQAPRIPSREELEFIRLMESYGKSEFGIKVDTLCKLIFVKELDQFFERELRFYKERYTQFKYIDVIPKGRIIKRNGAFYLIDNNNAKKEQMQWIALKNKICGILDNRNSERIYGKIELKGQTSLELMSDDELINLMEIE